MVSFSEAGSLDMAHWNFEVGPRDAVRDEGGVDILEPCLQANRRSNRWGAPHRQNQCQVRLLWEGGGGKWDVLGGAGSLVGALVEAATEESRQEFRHCVWKYIHLGRCKYCPHREIIVRVRSRCQRCHNLDSWSSCWERYLRAIHICANLYWLWLVP